MTIAFASALHQMRTDALAQIREATNDIRQMYIDDGYEPADASRMAADQHSIMCAAIASSLRGEQQESVDDE